MVTTILARFHRIDTLIREGKTGTPAQLARTIGVSERTIYQYIKQMKLAGAPILFNMLTKNYYYKYDGHFVCSFSFAVDNNESVPPAGTRVQVKSMKEYLEMMNMYLKVNYN